MKSKSFFNSQSLSNSTAFAAFCRHTESPSPLSCSKVVITLWLILTSYVLSPMGFGLSCGPTFTIAIIIIIPFTYRAKEGKAIPQPWGFGDQPLGFKSVREPTENSQSLSSLSTSVEELQAQFFSLGVVVYMLICRIYVAYICWFVAYMLICPTCYCRQVMKTVLR